MVPIPSPAPNRKLAIVIVSATSGPLTTGLPTRSSIRRCSHRPKVSGPFITVPALPLPDASATVAPDSLACVDPTRPWVSSAEAAADTFGPHGNGQCVTIVPGQVPLPTFEHDHI